MKRGVVKIVFDKCISSYEVFSNGRGLHVEAVLLKKSITKF
jgi:hypothetical protein